MVAQGAPLIKIDDAELKAQVERARADHDLARQALDRTRQLLTEKAAATADLERAEAAARSSQASLDLLQLRLDRTIVRAPFAGVVGQRRISLGDYVTTSTQLLTLQTIAPARATFSVPERYAADLKSGRTGGIPGRSPAGARFDARVDFVDPVITLPGRTITVKAITANSAHSLRPGMFIEARLAIGMRPRAMVIPEEAISPTAIGIVGLGGRRWEGDAARSRTWRTDAGVCRSPERHRAGDRRRDRRPGPARRRRGG